MNPVKISRTPKATWYVRRCIERKPTCIMEFHFRGELTIQGHVAQG